MCHKQVLEHSHVHAVWRAGLEDDRPNSYVLAAVGRVFVLQMGGFRSVRTQVRQANWQLEISLKGLPLRK